MVASDKYSGTIITGAAFIRKFFPAAMACAPSGPRMKKQNEEKDMQSRLTKSLVAAALVLLLSGTTGRPVQAADGYKLIGTEELKTWMKSSAPPTLIYSLSFVEFEEQRIPGSICIPMELMAESTDLPRSKDQPLIFYCKGPG